MIVVKCNACGWIGHSKELEILQTDAKYEDGKYVDYETCPDCGSIVALEDLGNDRFFTQAELRSLWGLFSDVPIDDADQILEDFLGFKAGTDRFEVWHWFDEKYAGGVVKLIETWSN